MLPVVLDVTGRLALIVGGGPIGRRKAAALLAAGGHVRLVCLEARPPDETALNLTWLTTPYEPIHLDGIALAFASGPPAVNARVVADVRARRVWVNTASDPARAISSCPPSSAGAISCSPSAPAARSRSSARCAHHLSREFDDAFGSWVALLAELRSLIQAAYPQEERARRGTVQPQRMALARTAAPRKPGSGPRGDAYRGGTALIARRLRRLSCSPVQALRGVCRDRVAVSSLSSAYSLETDNYLDK